MGHPHLTFTFVVDFEVRRVHEEFRVVRSFNRFEDVFESAWDDSLLRRGFDNALHRVRFPTSRLTIGEHRAVVTLQDALGKKNVSDFPKKWYPTLCPYFQYMCKMYLQYANF